MSTWDSETAEWYAKNYGDYPTNKLAVEALNLTSDSIVVDVGCGTGSALRQAARQVTEGTLIGVDPVPRMIEIAQAQTTGHNAADRIAFVKGAAENLPIEDALADFVFAFDSFDHWQDQIQGLHEVRRVLKSSGLLVVVKDSGLPNGSEFRQAFVRLLLIAGFQIIEERVIDGGDVAFRMWICSQLSK